MNCVRCLRTSGSMSRVSECTCNEFPIMHCKDFGSTPTLIYLDVVDVVIKSD